MRPPERHKQRGARRRMLDGPSAPLPQTRGGITHPPGIPLPLVSETCLKVSTIRQQMQRPSTILFQYCWLWDARSWTLKLRTGKPLRRRDSSMKGPGKSLTLVEDTRAWVPVSLRAVWFASLQCARPHSAATSCAYASRERRRTARSNVSMHSASKIGVCWTSCEDERQSVPTPTNGRNHT